MKAIKINKFDSRLVKPLINELICKFPSVKISYEFRNNYVLKCQFMNIFLNGKGYTVKKSDVKTKAELEHVFKYELPLIIIKEIIADKRFSTWG